MDGMFFLVSVVHFDKVHYDKLLQQKSLGDDASTSEGHTTTPIAVGGNTI